MAKEEKSQSFTLLLQIDDNAKINARIAIDKEIIMRHDDEGARRGCAEEEEDAA